MLTTLPMEKQRLRPNGNEKMTYQGGKMCLQDHGVSVVVVGSLSSIGRAWDFRDREGRVEPILPSVAAVQIRQTPSCGRSNYCPSAGQRIKRPSAVVAAW